MAGTSLVAGSSRLLLGPDQRPARKPQRDRLPLSSVLIEELRGRDPEYQAAHGGPPVRRVPRAVRPSAHGTAVGLRVHHERGEPVCRTCAGLLAELHQAGLLQRAARESGSTLKGGLTDG